MGGVPDEVQWFLCYSVCPWRHGLPTSCCKISLSLTAVHSTQVLIAAKASSPGPPRYWILFYNQDGRRNAVQARAVNRPFKGSDTWEQWGQSLTIVDAWILEISAILPYAPVRSSINFTVPLSVANLMSCLACVGHFSRYDEISRPGRDMD